RPEPVVDRLAVEGDRDLDVPAAVDVRLDAVRPGVLTQDDQLLDRLVAVFEENEQLAGKAVLRAQKCLERGGRLGGGDHEVPDLRDPLALIENVDLSHRLSLRSGCGAVAPSTGLIARGTPTRKESRRGVRPRRAVLSERPSR